MLTSESNVPYTYKSDESHPISVTNDIIRGSRINGRRARTVIVAVTLLLGSLWAVVVPPFEAPDESYYYKTLVEHARTGVRRGAPLYQFLMAPALKIAGTPSRPLEGRRNPAFRFVNTRLEDSNGDPRGRVNMFMHGSLEGVARTDLNRMYLLRFVTLGLWLGVFLLVFETARILFGRDDLALMTAGLCLCLPGVSFFSSKIHQESMAAIVSAA